MIKIGEVVVSLDIIEKEFCCNLQSCRGLCCVDGDAGAPLEGDEPQAIEKVLPLIWDILSPQAHQVIEKQGVACLDSDGELVTPLVKRDNCVFTYYDEQKICRCALEKAYYEHNTDFVKPISCHLYPIRLKTYSGFIAANYDRRRICSPARAMGMAKGVKVYRFLENPLVRRFGREWYDQLVEVATAWENR